MAKFVTCNFAHQIDVKFFMYIDQLYFQEAENALRHYLQEVDERELALGQRITAKNVKAKAS